MSQAQHRAKCRDLAQLLHPQARRQAADDVRWDRILCALQVEVSSSRYCLLSYCYLGGHALSHFFHHRWTIERIVECTAVLRRIMSWSVEHNMSRARARACTKTLQRPKCVQPQRLGRGAAMRATHVMRATTAASADSNSAQTQSEGRKSSPHSCISGSCVITPSRTSEK